MSREEVFPQLAANMSAVFKKVWKIIGATNPSDIDLVMNRIVELAKDGVYERLHRHRIDPRPFASRILAIWSTLLVVAPSQFNCLNNFR